MVTTHNLGFPRIGAEREPKFGLEPIAQFARQIRLKRANPLMPQGIRQARSMKMTNGCMKSIHFYSWIA
jgi:hypothetical protein